MPCPYFSVRQFRRDIKGAALAQSRPGNRHHILLDPLGELPGSTKRLKRFQGIERPVVGRPSPRRAQSDGTDFVGRPNILGRVPDTSDLRRVEPPTR